MKPTHLQEHPEGGRFREVFRSQHEVVTTDCKKRSALTHIYFSLNKGEVSKFHKVTSDEVWNLYRGAVLLYLWDGSENRPVRIELSDTANQYCQVVEAGMWQAAEPLVEEVLVGCSVGPGFEFVDFSLMEPDTDSSVRLLAVDPVMSRFI